MLQRLIANNFGGFNAVNVFTMIDNFKGNGFREPITAIPMFGDSWSEWDCSVDDEFHRALTYDEPQTQWVVVSAKQAHIAYTLRKFDADWRKWNRMAFKWIKAIILARTDIFMSNKQLASVIYAYLAPAPQRVKVKAQDLANDYFCCDEGYLGCVPCAKNLGVENISIHCLKITYGIIHDHQNSREHGESLDKLYKNKRRRRNNVRIKPTIN